MYFNKIKVRFILPLVILNSFLMTKSNLREPQLIVFEVRVDIGCMTDGGMLVDKL